MRSSLLLLLAISSLAACGSAPARRATSAPPSATAAPEEPPARVVLLPGFGMYLTSPGRDAQNRTLLSIGGLRAAMGDEETTVMSRDALVWPIVATARTDRGWLALDRSGAMWRASDFVGALEPIGAVGLSTFDIAGQSSGLLAVLDAPRIGDLFVTDGAVPAQRVTGLPSRAVLSAAFIDARRGLAALDGGQLAMTDDAGASWRALDTEALGRRVEMNDAGFVVGPAEDPFGRERWFVDASGAVTRGPRPVEPGLEMLGRVLPRATIEAVPAMVLPSAPGLPDGRLVMRPPGDAVRDVWLLRPLSSRREVVHDLLPAAGCKLEPWGPAVAIVCGTNAEPRTVYRTTDGHRVERVITIATAPYATPLFGGDGGSIVWRGWSDGRAREAAEEGTAAMWVARASSEWRPEAMTELDPEDAWQLDAVSGDWLMTSRTGVNVARLPTGARVTPRFPEGATPRTAGLTIDGRLWATTADEQGGSRALWLGAPDGELTRIELPAGALAGAMRDERRGIAVGGDVAHAWRTLDGGQSWEPIAPALRGNPAHVTLLSPTGRIEHGAITCRWTQCNAHGPEGVQLVVYGWGAIAPATGRGPIVAAPVPPEDATPIRERTDPIREPQLSCAFAGPIPPTSSRPVSGRVPEGARSVSVRGGIGVVRVVRTSEGGRVQWQLAWRATDARGSFEGASRASEAPEWVTDDESLDGVKLVGITRAGVLVRPHREAKVYWAPRGAAIVELPDRIEDGGFRTLDLDGRRAVLLVAARDELRLYELGPTGAPSVVVRRRIETMTRTPAIVRDGALLTIAATLPGRLDLRVFPRARTELPRDVAASGPLVACAGPRAADAIDAWLVSGPGVMLNLASGLGGAETRADIELSRGQACVRAIEWWGTPNGSGRLVAGADGRLTGDVQTDERRVPVRCEIQQVARR